MSQITLDLKSETANKLNQYIKSFGSKDLLFEKFIDYHKKKLRREIAKMQIDLKDFEKKYDMSSAAFYQKFESGELTDEKDFMIWAGVYEMQQQSKNKLNQLS